MLRLLFCCVTQAFGQVHSPLLIPLLFHFAHTLQLLSPLGKASLCALPSVSALV